MTRFDESTLELLRSAAQLGCSRREAAAIIGAPVRTARRDLDAAARRMQELYEESTSGDWASYSAHMQASYAADKLVRLENRRARDLIADEVCDALWP